MSVPTTTDGGVQVDGVRFGFARYPQSTTLLPAPVRVYDTTAGLTPISAGQTRVVSLTSQVPTGANGALVTLTAFNTVGAGQLKIGPSSPPAVPGLRWARTGDVATNSVTSAVSGGYSLLVNATGTGSKTDLYVDLIGYLV